MQAPDSPFTIKGYGSAERTATSLPSFACGDRTFDTCGVWKLVLREGEREREGGTCSADW